jgi:hypothetical protein
MGLIDIKLIFWNIDIDLYVSLQYPELPLTTPDHHKALTRTAVLFSTVY